jgi:hypothetical protein
VRLAVFDGRSLPGSRYHPVREKYLEVRWLSAWTAKWSRRSPTFLGDAADRRDDSRLDPLWFARRKERVVDV